METLWERLAQTEDPKMKWAILEEATEQEQDEAALARLWWHARYAYTNKKQTIVQDKFVWMIVCFANWIRAGHRDRKGLQKTYLEMMDTPALAAAMAAGDRLYDELLEASCLYVQTLRDAKPMFGMFSARKADAASTNTRVAGEVVGLCLVPMAQCCGGYPHCDLLMRAMYQAARASFTGIQPVLLGSIEALSDTDVRDRIRLALRDNSFGDA